MLWLLVIILVVIAFAGAPNVGFYHHSYGWGPSGIIGVVLVIVVVLLLLGRF